MNLQQLRYFVALAEVGNFHKASERLCITQPALSNSIRNLEEELGLVLFVRTNRKTSLTAQGRRFYNHVTIALHELDRAVQESVPRPPRPVIRIGGVASVQRQFLPDLLTRYRHQGHEDVVFDIKEAVTTFDCLKLIRGGDADIVFAGAIQNDPMYWIPVLPQTLVVAVNSENPLADRDSVSLSDLRGLEVISYRRPSLIYYRVQSIAQAVGLSFTEAFNDEIAAVSYLLANPETVALLLDTGINPISDRMKHIGIEEFERPFHMVGAAFSKATVQQNLALADFVDYLQESYADLRDVIPLSRLFALQVPEEGQ